MDIMKSKDFVYATATSPLPHDLEAKDSNSLLVMLIKDTMQSVEILDSKKLVRKNFYLRYNKPQVLNIKVFNKVIKKKVTPSELKDLKAFLRTMEMMYVSNAKEAKGKNFVLDTSEFNEAFFSHCMGKNVKLIATMYASMLRDYLDRCVPSDTHHERYIVLNTAHWGVSKSMLQGQTATVIKELNPISLMYWLMKYDVDSLKILQHYTVVIMDSQYGWFKFNVEELDKDSYLKFSAVMQKLKTPDVTINDPEAKHAEEVHDSEDNADETTDEEKEVYARGKTDEEDTSEEDKLLQAYNEIELQDEKAKRSIQSTKRDAELREAQKKIRINNITLADLQTDAEEAKESFIEEKDFSSKIISPQKNMKKSRFDNFNESYVKKQMTKDLVSVFDCMKDRSAPVYIRKIDIEDTSTPMDLKETWHVQLEGSDRVRHSVTIDIPKIYDKNYLYLGGNRKRFDNQLFSIPVIKIAPTTVQICTNYNKVFMYRYGDILSPKVTVFKKIILNNPNKFVIKRGNGMALSENTRTTIEYDSLAKDFVDIQIKGTGFHLKFDQKFFKKQIENKKIKALDDKFIYVGWDDKATKDLLRAVPINTDSSAGEESDEATGVINLFVSQYKKYTGEDFWELAGDKDKPGKRFMYTRCKIMEKFIPTVLLLAYWEGLSTVLRKAHIKFEFTDKRTKIGYDKGRVEFADGFLIFEREPTEHSLLMNGLSLVDTKNYNFSDFDHKDVYLNIFDALYNSRILGASLDGYYDNLIDPKTFSYLKTHNYPTDIVSLMIFANALLADNNYVSELDMSNYRLRSMEIIYAYLYKIIGRAYGEYKRTSMNANPTKISVPKNELIKQLLTSNIVEDYSIINPITEKEKLHNATHKGPSGMNLERSYTEEKRCFDPSMSSLVAISTSPDANCGVQRELTMEPKILDTLGTIDIKKPFSEMKDVNLFSYAEALTTNSVMRDDAIRVSMATKQSKHLVPTKDMCPVLVTTGADKLLPYTASKDFTIVAKDDGKVVDFDEKNHIMILEYKDKTHEAVNLNPVIVKNGGGGFYLSNTLVTKYKKGNTFKKNDIVAANREFFTTGWDGTRFAIGTLAKCAIMSSFCTYEDAKMVTQNLAERMSSDFVMKKHIVLGKNATIANMVKVGQQIKAGEPLMTFEQSNSEEAMNQLLRNIGEDLREDIKDFGKTALKSKYDGVVEDIKIYSTFDLDEMSPSLKKIVGEYWARIRSKKSLVRKYKITDPTYTGSTFMETDGPMKPDENDKIKGYKVIEGGVIIEFYVKYTDVVGVGDKLCDFAALKGVTCTVIPKGKEPFAMSEPNEEISTIFPPSSVMARMTVSIISTAWANMCIVELKKRLKTIYENG